MHAAICFTFLAAGQTAVLVVCWIAVRMGFGGHQ